jgi:hypothetical protein
MRSFFSAILFASALIAAVRAGERTVIQTDSPESAMRAVIQALFVGDEQNLKKHTLPHPKASLLIAKHPPTGDELKQLIEETRELKFRQVLGYRFDGRPIQRTPSGYPPGTTARFLAPVRGTLTVFTVVETADGWKVDLRWWIEMIEMERRDSVSKESPEYVVKSFLLALLQLNPNEARKFVTPETDMNRLFADAPPYAEPSDQLPALTIEMPLAEAGPEESYPLPSGRIAKGSDKPNERKLLVGLFGPTEMVFEVVKIKNEWKVAGLSYFRLLNQ